MKIIFQFLRLLLLVMNMIWLLFCSVSNNNGNISWESFISIKDAHSLFIRALKSGYSSSDVLNCHLMKSLIDVALMFIIRETGAWMPTMRKWIVVSGIYLWRVKGWPGRRWKEIKIRILSKWKVSHSPTRQVCIIHICFWVFEWSASSYQKYLSSQLSGR